jgi:hypothetical protein
VIKSLQVREIVGEIISPIGIPTTTTKLLQIIPQRCRPIDKCHVNGSKYVKEVSSSILTLIYLCSMLVGGVTHLGL